MNTWEEDNYIRKLSESVEKDLDELKYFDLERMDKHSEEVIKMFRDRAENSHSNWGVHEKEKRGMGPVSEHQCCVTFNTDSGAVFSISYDKPQMLVRGAYGADFDLRDVDHMELCSDSDCKHHWLSVRIGNSSIGFDID